MLDALRYMAWANYPVESILHIGANEGQERHDYEASGASPCIYVEPVDAVFAKLAQNIDAMPGHTAVQAVCSDTEGESVTFNVASNGGQSSSFLALGAHAGFHPTITYTATQPMLTTTVDHLVERYSPRRVPNLLVVDAQGADLHVLRGAARSLRAIDGVFVEASEEPLYAGGCTHSQITGFLEPFGFRMRWMVLDSQGHGEAFYCRPRPEIGHLPRYDGNRAWNRPASQSSLSRWSEGDATQGPSGGANGAITGQFGFHTDCEDDPWWQVDLEAVHPLQEVRIYNRMDSARERSRTLRVLLSEDGSAWTQVHDQDGYTFGGADGRPLRVMLAGIPARYVRLQLNARTYLHLDEVQVF